MALTDTRAEGFKHPEEHLARRVEKRTPAEMMNLLTLDALIATYGMDGERAARPHAPGALALPGWR